MEVQIYFFEAGKREAGNIWFKGKTTKKNSQKQEKIGYGS